MFCPTNTVHNVVLRPQRVLARAILFYAHISGMDALAHTLRPQASQMLYCARCAYMNKYRINN